MILPNPKWLFNNLDGLLSADSVFPVFPNFLETNGSAVWRQSLNPNSTVWFYKSSGFLSWDVENPAPTDFSLKHSQS